MRDEKHKVNQDVPLVRLTNRLILICQLFNIFQHNILNILTFQYFFFQLAGSFIQTNLNYIQGTHFISVYIPWESNPWPPRICC